MEKKKTVENPQKGACQRTTGRGELTDEMNLTQATSSGSFNTNRITNNSDEFRGNATLKVIYITYSVCMCTRNVPYKKMHL